MPSFDILLAFTATTAIFAFVPGPAMLYAAARTMSGGRSAGLMAVVGIHLGAYVHIAAAAAGLTVLFHAVPLAYAILKLAGAVYLIWLGVSLFLARMPATGEATAVLDKTGRKAFLESILTEVLNPKTAIFFTAFLPQFIDQTAGLPVWVQFAVLGVTVNLIFTSADVVAVLLAGLIMARLKRSGIARMLVQRAGGAVLVGLGTHLALQRH